VNRKPSKDPKEMQERPPRTPAEERALSEEEPGAHSGAESPAQDRAIPGTVSSREGYRTEGGTAHGDALEGVEKRPDDDR
jgi:hypothetical protein